jgi:uncharacterized protein YjbI with pentapeptide repeats
VTDPAAAGRRVAARDLTADCANCFGLCCVAPAFAKSADFAIDKPAGHACPNLGEDHRCTVHSRLREIGFRGCTVFDCFGAGQHVSQGTLQGVDWRMVPSTAKSAFDAFDAMRQLHELLWYLTEAIDFPQAQSVYSELGQASATITALTELDHASLLAVDLPAVRDRANVWLRRASELVRAATPGPRPDHRGAELIGAQLAGVDLRAASFRGARLIAANLANADLRGADFIGADLRDADLSGADLRGAIFLIQAQLDAAVGDGQTQLPTGRRHPAHWRQN